MQRIDPSSIANAILDAPGWARVGITAPNAWLREDAARELARAIVETVEPGDGPVSPSQASLPL